MWQASVVEYCKEQFFEESLDARQLAMGLEEESPGDVDFSCGVDVKLGGNSFNVSSVGARRSRYHSPPLVSCLAVDEGDAVSGTHITHSLYPEL